MQLHEYAQRFADPVFAAFPEWRAYRKPDPSGDLVINVPAPTAHRDHLLIVADCEITISFDWWHGHFDQFSDIPVEVSFADAISFLHAFLREDICVAVAWKDDNWCWSETIEPGESLRFKHGATRINVRSWQGTHDAEYVDSDVAQSSKKS